MKERYYNCHSSPTWFCKVLENKTSNEGLTKNVNAEETLGVWQRKRTKKEKNKEEEEKEVEKWEKEEKMERTAKENKKNGEEDQKEGGEKTCIRKGGKGEGRK